MLLLRLLDNYNVVKPSMQYKKENPEKWSQSGHIVQDVLTNKQ